MTKDERFTQICSELDSMIVNPPEKDSLEYIKWVTKAERFLAQTYGEDSRELKDFYKMSYTAPLGLDALSKEKAKQAFVSFLQTIRAIFSVYLEELSDESEECRQMPCNEIIKDIELCERALAGTRNQQRDLYYEMQGKYKDLPLSELQTNPLYLKHHPDEYYNCILVIRSYLQSRLGNDDAEDAAIMEEKKWDYSNVFIVHGHDEALKQSVARVLEKQDIKPIILHEQPNKGATIIEKFERNSNVGAVICLFTADDVGRAKDEDQEHDRARQNVVFEAGYFMGSLGRDHVILLAEKGVEMPSDIEGVVYTDLADWKLDLLRELREMGFSVDYNKID